MKYTPVGVDIAKHLIQVHFIDEHTGEGGDKSCVVRIFRRSSAIGNPV